VEFPQDAGPPAQAIFASAFGSEALAGHALGGIIGPRYGWQVASFHRVAVAGLFRYSSFSGLTTVTRPALEVVPISRLLRIPAFVA